VDCPNDENLSAYRIVGALMRMGGRELLDAFLDALETDKDAAIQIIHDLHDEHMKNRQ